jgi:hypothetical protein
MCKSGLARAKHADRDLADKLVHFSKADQRAKREAAQKSHEGLDFVLTI